MSWSKSCLSKETKGRALLAALKKERELDHARIQIYLNAKEVVNGDFDRAICPVIADIKKLILNFDIVEVLYIPRIFNSIALSLLSFVLLIIRMRVVLMLAKVDSSIVCVVVSCFFF